MMSLLVPAGEPAGVAEMNCALVWFLPGRRSWVAVVSRG
jgi:hypothetical protein